MSSSERRVFEAAGGEGTMGKILGETASALTCQLTTSLKCSAYQLNLSPSPCSVVPSLATSDDEAGLENFLFKGSKFFIKEPPLPCCYAMRAWDSASAAHLLHQ